VVEMTVREARFGPRRRVRWDDAVGQVCAETIALFPPGIAVLVAGEVVSAAQRDAVEVAVRHGRRLHGASDPTGRWVRVVDRAPAG
jgi:arginine/lysine/ornithine decarboxylase